MASGDVTGARDLSLQSVKLPANLPISCTLLQLPAFDTLTVSRISLAHKLRSQESTTANPDQERLVSVNALSYTRSTNWEGVCIPGKAKLHLRACNPAT